MYVCKILAYWGYAGGTLHLSATIKDFQEVEGSDTRGPIW